LTLARPDSNIHLKWAFEIMTTRNRILLAAERLFAEKGVDNATLKMVTQEAGVNLAAVNYHFGSKEELAFAVFDDLADRISRRRLALLAERKLAAGGKPLGVEEIVFFFMEPYVLHEGGRDGALLINMILHQRVAPTKAVELIIKKYFDKVALRFVEAFSEAIPHLDKKALFWRYYFMVSSILFGASERGQGNRLSFISGGHADLSDSDELVHQLTMFIAGGMAAPKDSQRIRLTPKFVSSAVARSNHPQPRSKIAGTKPAASKKHKGEKIEPVAIPKRTSRSR
jgi:AcrR family transcriptional regulator